MANLKAKNRMRKSDGGIASKTAGPVFRRFSSFPVLSLAGLVFAAGICLILFSDWYETAAYLQDTETASASLLAGNVGFDVVPLGVAASGNAVLRLFSVAAPDSAATSTATTTAELAGALPDFSPLASAQPALKTISLVDTGSIDFQYTVQIPYTIGTLCNYLNLNVRLNDREMYDGPLTAEKFFVIDAGMYSDSAKDWLFAATLNGADPSLEGQTCYFGLVFNATQAGGKGYFAAKTIGNNITWIEPGVRPAVGQGYEDSGQNEPSGNGTEGGGDGEVIEKQDILPAENYVELASQPIVSE